MLFWLLSASYWIHLIMTVIWLGGLTLLALVALPAWRAGQLDGNQWLTLQQRLAPWVNVSMVLLWVTGFVQMTNDVHYEGFLAVNSTWALAMLVKHVAALAMSALSLYVQFSIHPAIGRLALLRERRPAAAVAEQGRLEAQEVRLLRLNLACALVVLLCTAIATAV